MIGWIGSGTELLLQAARALPDTIYTKQVVSEPGLWSKITGVASGIMTITVIILTVALVPAAWNFRKSYKKVSDMLDKIYGDVNPLMRHASAIADNVDYISTSIRVDVQQVSQTVAAVNQRLQEALESAEDRMKQLNALLDVVQEEAESAFVTTASTIRGVQTGINQAFDQEELFDGDYDEDRADSGEKPRPRVRPRNGSGRRARAAVRPSDCGNNRSRGRRRYYALAETRAIGTQTRRTADALRRSGSNARWTCGTRGREVGRWTREGRRALGWWPSGGRSSLGRTASKGRFPNGGRSR
jgi:uncharacterized protein YoxC